MSLVTKDWQLVVDLVDRGGKSFRRTFHMTATDAAGDASAVFADVATILSNIGGVTELKVKSYQVQKVFAENALTLPTSAEAEGEQLLHVSAKIVGDPTKSGTYDIPGPKQLCFKAASGPDADNPNFAYGPLDTFLEMFNSAGSDLCKLSDGESWDVNTAKGKKIHRKSTTG